MISKKILYSEQLLQLVLALSLLQVDPINYLEWGVSRIHSDDDGSPWQLEIAQTLFSDYPYMNRKTYIPEDLGRFNYNNYGLQTYLLNLSDDPISAFHSNNITSRFIENNNNNNNNTTSIENATDAATSNQPQQLTSTSTSSTTNLLNLIQESSSNSREDPFLHADLFHSQDVESIAEQNLADLHDYEEIVEPPRPSSLLVSTKNEIASESDVWHEFRGLQYSEQDSEEQQNSTNAHANRINVIELSLNDTSYTRTAVIDWSDYLPFVNDSAAESQHKTKEETDEKQHADLAKEKKKTDDVGDNEDRNNNELVITSSVELTIEEMDLIEVLWKQDVDLGYSPSVTTSSTDSTLQKKIESTQEEDDVEKLKALLELKSDKKSDEKEVDNDNSEAPWPNLSYTIDTETGEYIFSSSGNNNTELENLLFDDNLLVDVNDISDKEKENTESEESGEAKGEEEKVDDLEAILEENNLKLDFEPGKEDDFLEDLNSSLSILLDEADNLDLLGDMMLQPPSSHFQHPRQPAQNYAHCVNSYRQSGYQGRVPLGRTMSMEQRWQDLANLLSFPPAMGMTDMGSHAAAVHYSQHYPYQTSGPMSHGQHSQFAHPHSHSVLHNASLAEIASQQPTTSHHLQPYSSNLGSAVATSMHLTSNSTSETDAGNSAYKMEHDLMYYSQTAEMNHPSDGILNIFNDEDLQLMDMAVNEGMYTMRMLDQNSNCTNSSALASNPHFNNTLLGSHMPTNLSSGIGSVASTISAQHAATSGDRLDASSDSAVSSMGSERVASLSDGEWNEAGSDSAQEYHSRKLVGPYDYRFNNRMLDANRQPVAQKKHQMYGKRFAHESHAILPPPSLSHANSSSTDSIPNIPIKYEPYDAYNNSVAQSSSAAAAAASVIKPPPSLAESETKYSYSLDFPHHRHKNTNALPSHELVHHNHTYTMPPHPTPQQLPNNNGANPKPQMRDKKTKKSDEEHMTRDEKRARALQIPISVHDIINLPMDEFNERLSKYDLSENQLSLIRDIRRRGKNKVAAQNCRKRKLDQIVCLADEVKDMKMRKDRFLREREMLLTERRRIKDKFAALYRHVFTNLRDSDGNPYSSYQYSLQQAADGNVVLVPRSDQNTTENGAAAAANGSGSSQRNSNSQHGSNNNNSSNFK